MSEESITKTQLLMSMLQNGWSWTQSDNPRFMFLKKETTVWALDPFEFSIQNLLEAMKHEAYERGKNKIIKGLENH